LKIENGDLCVKRKRGEVSNLEDGRKSADGKKNK
jgi:hypothetical protein